MGVGALFSLLPIAYVVYYLASGGNLLLFNLCRFLVARRCPLLAWDDPPLELPPEPMTVAHLGPCCGRMLAVSC